MLHVAMVGWALAVLCGSIEWCGCLFVFAVCLLVYASQIHIKQAEKGADRLV